MKDGSRQFGVYLERVGSKEVDTGSAPFGGGFAVAADQNDLASFLYGSQQSGEAAFRLVGIDRDHYRTDYHHGTT